MYLWINCPMFCFLCQSKSSESRPRGTILEGAGSVFIANVYCTSSSTSNGVGTISQTVSVLTHCVIFVQYTACVHLTWKWYQLINLHKCIITWMFLDNYYFWIFESHETVNEHSFVQHIPCLKNQSTRCYNEYILF